MLPSIEGFRTPLEWVNVNFWAALATSSGRGSSLSSGQVALPSARVTTLPISSKVSSNRQKNCCHPVIVGSPTSLESVRAAFGPNPRPGHDSTARAIWGQKGLLAEGPQKVVGSLRPSHLLDVPVAELLGHLHHHLLCINFNHLVRHAVHNSRRGV